nr:MAG TPA: hypothetical protein [Caudoviricetes sp.]
MTSIFVTSIPNTQSRNPSLAEIIISQISPKR